MPFANGYDLHRPGRFRRLVRPLSVADGAGGMLAVGEIEDAGLAVRVDAAGAVRWSRRYSQRGVRFSLFDGAATNDGGFLLLAGTGEAAPSAGPDTLLRIDAAGAVVGSQRIDTDGYGGLRLVRGLAEAEEFLLLGWFPRVSRGYGSGVARVLRLNSDGAVLSAVDLAADPGGRLLDVVAGPDGYLLVGDGRDPRSVDQWMAMDSEFDVLGGHGLIVDLASDLSVRGAWRLGDAKGAGGLSPRIALAPGDNQLVVAGCRRDGDQRQSTFVARLSRRGRSLTLLNAVTLEVRAIGERPAAGDIVGREIALLIQQDSGVDAVVTRLHADLTTAGETASDLAGDSVAVDLRAASRNTAMIASLWPSATRTESFLAGVDAAFDCCLTRPLEPRATAPLDLKIEPISLRARPLRVKARELKTGAGPIDVSVRSLCGVRVDWDGERMLQSPHLDLQAAGSDGSDASRGILLRWFLTGALENHLPKGDKATTTLAFNKPDDYVALYRARWPEAPPTRRLDLAVQTPSYVDDASRTLFFEVGSPEQRDLFAISFDDPAAYGDARQTADPAQSPLDFIAAYGPRPIEIELRGRLAVACDLTFQTKPGGTLRVETRSAADDRMLAPRQVSSRQVLGQADGPVKRLLAENLRSLRIKGDGARVLAADFICYEDVLETVNQDEAWAELGRFALTDEDTVAFERLEDPARFQVDGHWRKFNDGACVKVANYQDRWTATPDGLREGVKRYIQLSDTDPSATTLVAGAAPGDGAIELSYLDMLQVVSIDHHVARMLNLGCVDEAVEASRRYIHLAAYVTHGDLLDGAGARPVQHLYMSLPTGLDDARLPLVPDLDGVEYGLSVPTGSGPPHQLTDPQGYTPDADARYIRLYPGCGPLYAEDQGFWSTPDLFDLSRSSLPVVYGVEYRDQGASAWRDPELAHDPAYLDTRSPPCPEVLTTPFPAARYDRAFIHKETSPGVHEYGVYGVNIFSRSSAVGTPRATDATAFLRRNTLLPPSDLLVQFIEHEAPLLLTTAFEQAELAMFPAGSDRTFVRLCCNYGYSQDLAYPFADTIEILHRREIPRNVKGGLKASAPDSDPGRLRISTGTYFYSNGDALTPVLPAMFKANFIGGVLVAGSNRLIIEDIQWPGAPGPDPIFIVRRPTTTGVLVNNLGDNTLVTQDADLDLHAGDLIMAIENMAAGASWGAGNPLTTTIAIGDPAHWTTRTEAFTRPDGSSVRRVLRGFWKTASVQQVPANSRRYEITFDSFVLPPHPQANAPDPVNWWRGSIRLPVHPDNHEDRRLLNVVEVAADLTGNLVLVAHDDSGDPEPVLEASGLLVNYYPGYKVYLHADTARAFDWPALTPATGEGSRTTLVGVRSRDSGALDTAGLPYRSAVGIPQLMGAREIADPLTPQQPTGLAYATPPDVYHKSSYTMTVAFDHAPFAAVFYRGAASSILEALYDPVNTLPGVLAAIFPPDAYFANRFDDLLKFMDDGRTVMDAIPLETGGTYILPFPDHSGLDLTGPPAEDKIRIAEAIHRAFTPLTRQPLIYEFISTDQSYVPTNRPQVFRDANGDLLAPDLMDLSPMARRPATGHAVQFTDFTLDGSMNPNTLYFYFAREMSKDMQIGKASPISRPVKLINLTAPEPPQLRRMTLAPYDVTNGSNPRVCFELIDPVQIDPIARVRLFRATDPALALSVRTMEMVKDLELAMLPRTAEGAVMLVDDFAQDPFVPYGDPLFYKAAWVREVHYQDAALTDHLAQVLSKPTRTFLATLVDVVNPLPPEPTVTVTPGGSADERMVHVSWPTTVHNGTYFISQLNESGTWAQLGSIKSNLPMVTFDRPGALPVADEDGEAIYYRFKVDVMGSAGLLNTYDLPTTVRLDAI